MSLESTSTAALLSKYGLTDRVPVSHADIAEAALRWFRASQEWQEKSARHEPVCYDKVGKLLGELVELCRKHEAFVDVPMLPDLTRPSEPEPDGC